MECNISDKNREEPIAHYLVIIGIEEALDPRPPVPFLYPGARRPASTRALAGRTGRIRPEPGRVAFARSGRPGSGAAQHGSLTSRRPDHDFIYIVPPVADHFPTAERKARRPDCLRCAPRSAAKTSLVENLHFTLQQWRIQGE